MRDDCRACTAPLTAEERMPEYGGWCRPCAQAEMRFECRDPEGDWIADQEEDAA